MADLTLRMKLVQVSKNVASFVATPESTNQDDLSPSGRANYGQADLVISNVEALNEVRKHQYFDVTLSPVELSDAAAIQTQEGAAELDSE